MFRRVPVWLCCAAALAVPAQAEDRPVQYTLFGTPGLIEMPSAFALPDGTIASSLGGFENQQRASFTFQVTPRLTGTFRYSRIDERAGPGTPETHDRRFDFQYLLLEETERRPAVAIGLRDFMGTGIYSSEYVVASKTLSPTVRVTGGLGWGRMGTYGGFSNPLGIFSDNFNTRPPLDYGEGGTPIFDQYFRGDAAFFGGIEWQVRDNLRLVAEYSSDDYSEGVGSAAVEFNSPLNFGLTYTPTPGVDIGAYWLRGVELGLSATFYFDPAEPVMPSGLDKAPVPVNVRPADVRAAATWDRQGGAEVIAATTTLLDAEGINVEAMDISDREVRIRFENTRYRNDAQALGRVARTLTLTMPGSVETFVLEPMRNGVPLSSVSIQRTDMEELENTSDAAWTSLARARIGEADLTSAPMQLPPRTPAFEWGLSPFVEYQLFDGGAPVRYAYGLAATARYEIQPNLFVEGRARYLIDGNREGGSVSASNLQPVRSNVGLYGGSDGLGLDSLALHWYGRPGEALYSRVSVGYLERMFAGVSTELLWKPVDSRLALGAELNYVGQRSYDLGFGLQHFDDLGGPYYVLTGHASAYYDFENGFRTRVDVGRYLAGDWGATFALDRTFDNGWTVGAYATFTDVSFEDFGEGSFDKGITLTIPLDWAVGSPTRREVDVNLNSLSRDGGARLRVDGRLYDFVGDGHRPALSEGWGRFWR